MLAKDMCSKNQKVGHLIRPIHNNVFWAQRIFWVLQNSLFRTNDLYSKNKTEQIFARKELAPFCLQGYYLKKELYFGKINPFSDQSQGDAWEIVISELIVKHLFLFPPWVGETPAANCPRKGQARLSWYPATCKRENVAV